MLLSDELELTKEALKRSTQANARKNTPKNRQWVKGMSQTPLGPDKEKIITKARRNKNISRDLWRYARHEKELIASHEAKKKENQDENAIQDKILASGTGSRPFLE